MAAGTQTRAPAAGGQLLYRIPDVMRMLSMSRSVIFEQLRSGRLRSVRQGRARLIPAAAVAEYVALLEREAEAGLAPVAEGGPTWR
jgi:excisionase family DNA binding protein